MPLLTLPIQLAKEKLYPAIDHPLRLLVGLLVLGGLFTLILGYGFDRHALLAQLAAQYQEHLCWAIAAAILLRFVLHPRGLLNFARQQWLRLALAAGFVLSRLALQWPLGQPPEMAAASTLLPLTGQGFLAMIILVEGTEYYRSMTARALRPEQTLALSFMVLILLGSLFLMLPKATVQPGAMPWLSALFTATSAVCVTGLIVVDTATYFTPLGQGIILLLCQLGALGILTFATVVGMMVRGELGLREKMVLQDFTSSLQVGEITATLRLVVGSTLVIEAIGVLLLYWSWPEGAVGVTEQSRWWFAIFHAVSAFCNAGFSIFSESLAAPAVASHVGVNLTVMVLIILGGLGFSVLWETLQWLWGHLRKQPLRLSVQSRIVWAATGILIGFGALGFALLETRGVLASCSGSACWLGPLFQSVTARTAGFNTLPFDMFAAPTVVFLLLLMLIGVAPGSTGGGMKTTTAALLVMSAIAAIRGRPRVEAFGRTIPAEIGSGLMQRFFSFSWPSRPPCLS